MGYYHLTSENRKARKPHRCIWCGQAIIVGEQYIHIRGVMDGDMQTDDWHPECRTSAEGRWRHVRQWVADQITPDPPPSGGGKHDVER